MKEPKARVLVVDDYEPWRRFVSSTLDQHPEFLIVCEVADGLPAVEKAQELHPDLILLDIGLPKLNGIEAARRIREVAPNSKILFISENRSPEIAKEALRSGGGGYVVKSDAASQLMPAITAVLQEKRFVSASLATRDLKDRSAAQTAECSPKPVIAPPAPKTGMFRRHDVGLYSNDRCLVDSVTEFLGAALEGGNAAVVVATESHRHSILQSLQAQGLDIEAAIDEGRYIAADAAETVSSYMLNGMPDRARLLKAFGDLITIAAKASKAKHPRVAVFGEGVDLLWARGKEEAAIQVEKLCNELIKSHDVDVLCAYSLAGVEGGMHNLAFQRVCAEHSAAYSR